MVISRLVYSHMGEYTKSLSFHEQALEIEQKSLPANHPSLATSYGNIASLYSDMGEYTKSIFISRTSARNHEEESTCQSSFARHFLW